MSAQSLLLDASDVRSVVTSVGRDALMDALIVRLTEAIRAYDPDVSQMPPRSGVHYQVPEWGLLEWMPAHFGAQGTMVKLVGYHPANPERRGLPTVISTVCVFDTSSGHLMGLVDGTFLTAIRTGAASAVASRQLALPHSSTLGIIGCGAQAVTQVHALSRSFPIERIVAYDIRDDVARTLRDRVAFLRSRRSTSSHGSRSQICSRAADILCTCTSAAPGEGPVFPDVPHKTHLHINAIGSDFHGKFEVPVGILRRSLVCPDFYEQAIDEGECQQLAPGEIGPDLRTLVQNPDAYADAKTSSTVFDSTGWALEDHVAALMLFDYARDLGLGRSVAFECLPPDPKDPYSLLDTSDAVMAALAAIRARR